MSPLDAAVRAAIEAGRLGHLVTLDPDGSPQDGRLLAEDVPDGHT